MIQPPYTEAILLAHIREYTFDRFVTPTFFIRTKSSESSNYTLTIDVTGFHITRGSDSAVDLLYTDYPTLGTLFTAIISSPANVEIVYSGNFIENEPSNTLINNVQVLDKYYGVFRTNYFSQAYYEDMFSEYCQRIMGIKDSQLVGVNWDTQFASMDSAKMEHFAIWVAFQIVGKRRLYELATSTLQASSLGGNPLSQDYGGTNYLTESSFSLQNPSSNLELQIADVFTMSEKDTSLDNTDYSREIPKDMIAPWLSSDNPLMDYYSFWYRLQLWLRQRMENLYGDTILRQESIVVGKMRLADEKYMYSYFDSYPWVYSPYPRGIRTSPYGNLNHNP